MRLDMASYTSPSATEEVETEIPAHAPMWYDCVGILLHSGSAQGGHYTALLRQTPADEWFEFNDHKVGWDGLGWGGVGYGGEGWDEAG